MFEGTAVQMRQSLSRILPLPDQTLVYATHEYTLANLEFARWADPGNAELAIYQAPVLIATRKAATYAAYAPSPVQP